MARLRILTSSKVFHQQLFQKNTNICQTIQISSFSSNPFNNTNNENPKSELFGPPPVNDINNPDNTPEFKVWKQKLLGETNSLAIIIVVPCAIAGILIAATSIMKL